MNYPIRQTDAEVFERVRSAHLHVTRRERDVLRELLDGGKSNKEIANALYLTEATVKVYFSKLSKKLGGMSRVAMALWAQRRQLSQRYE